MGPMIFTGLACFGTAIAQGLIASRAPRTAAVQVGPSASRALAIVLLAFVQGVAVLGVVVGILALVAYGVVSDPTAGLLAAGPAIVGAIIGWELIVLRRTSSDPGIAGIGAAFIAGIATLGVVVAILAAVTDRTLLAGVSDAPFVFLGVLSGVSALAIGVTGSRALEALAGADDQRARSIRAAQIARSAPLQGLAVIATVIAIVLLTVSR